MKWRITVFPPISVVLSLAFFVSNFSLTIVLYAYEPCTLRSQRSCFFLYSWIPKQGRNGKSLIRIPIIIELESSCVCMYPYFQVIYLLNFFKQAGAENKCAYNNFDIWKIFHFEKKKKKKIKDRKWDSIFVKHLLLFFAFSL